MRTVQREVCTLQCLLSSSDPRLRKRTDLRAQHERQACAGCARPIRYAAITTRGVGCICAATQRRSIHRRRNPPTLRAGHFSSVIGTCPHRQPLPSTGFAASAAFDLRGSLFAKQRGSLHREQQHDYSDHHAAERHQKHRPGQEPPRHRRRQRFLRHLRQGRGTGRPERDPARHRTVHRVRAHRRRIRQTAGRQARYADEAGKQG